MKALSFVGIGLKAAAGFCCAGTGLFGLTMCLTSFRSENGLLLAQGIFIAGSTAACGFYLLNQAKEDAVEVLNEKPNS